MQIFDDSKYIILNFFLEVYIPLLLFLIKYKIGKNFV